MIPIKENAANPKMIDEYSSRPLLSHLDTSDMSLLEEALNLGDVEVLLKSIASYRGPLPSKLGLLILAVWGNESADVLLSVVRKIEITDTSFSELSNSSDWSIRLVLAGREELSAPQLVSLVNKSVAGSYRSDMAKIILKHRNCDSNVLRAMWVVAEYMRPSILRRPQLPEDLQMRIARDGELSEKLSLLKHVDVHPDVNKYLTSVLTSEGTPSTQNDLLRYCEVPGEIIVFHAFSDNLQVAAAAADRISEVASSIRIRKFVRHHTGFCFGPLQNLIAQSIRSGLPLGWFVYACYFLKRIVPDDPKLFFELVTWLMSQPHALHIRSVVVSGARDLALFDRFISLLSPHQRQKFGLVSLRNGDLTARFLRGLQPIQEGFDEGFSFDSTGFERVSCLRTFREEYVFQLNVYREKNVWFNPTRRRYWQWVSTFDGMYLPTGHKIKVVRSSRSLRKLGAALRNCLNREYSIEGIRAGEFIVLSFQKDDCFEFAAEVRIADATIIQLYGPRNSPAPTDIRHALTAVLKAARPGTAIEPDKDPARLYGVLADHVI